MATGSSWLVFGSTQGNTGTTGDSSMNASRRFLWDGHSWCPTLGMGSPLLSQILVMLEPQHLLAQRSGQSLILDLHLCQGFYSTPSPVHVALGHGGMLGMETITPKRAHPPFTSRTQLLVTEKIMGREALQPLLIFCLGGTAKLDIWDALLLLELH